MAKSLTEKFEKDSKIVKVIEKEFWGHKPGDSMLIASPRIFAETIKSIPAGNFVPFEKLRENLAQKEGTDFTCPMTTGIFTRIAVEYWEEDPTRLNGELPFWRVVSQKDNFFKKLSPEMQDLLIQKQTEEGIQA